MNVDKLSINQLLDILGIQQNELISRNQINVVIERKLEHIQDKKKSSVLKNIQKRLDSYLDDLDLNTIFRGDDLSLTKNIVNSENDKFTIRNPSMKMQNSFIQTEAAGDLNPLKKRTKSHILHINTRHREKNSPDVYNKQLIKSMKNTLPTRKIQQLLNNRVNISSIQMTNGKNSTITLFLDVDLPDTVSSTGKISFILNENINNNNIFKTHNFNNSHYTKKSSKVLVFASDVNGNDFIKETKYNQRFQIENVPFATVNDYGNHQNGTPITDNEFNKWTDNGQNIPGLDVPPFGDTYRNSIGHPLVRLYGTRQGGLPEKYSKQLTSTDYGNYKTNTVAVVIGSATSLVQSQETENDETGIYKEPNNNFTINLSTVFNNVIKISMESFSFTNSIYTFSTARKNNYFEIKYDNDIDIDSKDVSIPDGTYTGEQLATYLNNKITYLNKKTKIYVRYSTITGKLFFYGGSRNSFTLIFGSNTNKDTDISQDGKYKLNTNLEKNAGWAMGFKRSYYISTNEKDTTNQLDKGVRGYSPNNDKIYILNDSNSVVPTSVADINLNDQYVEAESIYNKNTCKTMFLVVDDFNYNNYNNHYNTFNGDIVNSNILAKIQLKNNKSDNFNFIHDTMGDVEYRVRVFLGPVRIERLHIKLIDEEGNPVDIHETDYNLSLRFDTLYDL